MNRESDIPNVCNRMEELRAQLRTDMHAVRNRVQERTDWRYYMRRHPWIIMASAGLAGYWLIPRTKKVHRHETEIELAAPPSEVESPTTAEQNQQDSDKPGLKSQLIAVGATALTRAVFGMIAGRLGESLGQGASETSANPSVLNSSRDPAAHRVNTRKEPSDVNS